MRPSRPAAIPLAITPAMIWTCLIADDDAELASILEAPLIRAYYVMQTPAALMRQYGFEHPLGEHWRGYQDITPEALPRERVVAMLKKVSLESLLEDRAARQLEADRPYPQGLHRSGAAGAEDPGLRQHGGAQISRRAPRRRCRTRRMN
jgi:hypothetical protein